MLFSSKRTGIMGVIVLTSVTLSTGAVPVLAAQAIPIATHQNSNIRQINESAYGLAEDDTDFLFRLGMLEGHLMIGHDLLKHNQASLALPHFGHPVRELYDDIADYLKKHNFPPFDSQLADLEVAVTTAPLSSETEAKYQAMVVTVHKARELAPAQLRASLPEMIKVCANTIDAASGEYNEALERGQIRAVVEYHDSRGYIQYVHQQIDALTSAYPDEVSQAILKRFKAIVARAEWIVEPLIPDHTPRASVGQYREVASDAEKLSRESSGLSKPITQPKSL